MNSTEIKELLVEKAKECCGNGYYEEAFNKRFIKLSKALYALKIMILVGAEIQVTEISYLKSLDKISVDTVFLSKDDINELTKHIDDLS